MDIEKYKTIKELNIAEIVEKKSRFIATAMPTANLEEATYFLGQMRKKYVDATHNTYAFTLGIGKVPHEKFSDDGEPSGTAGMPILTVLRGNAMKNITVVVTRYYGGTLLGTGGLVKAYSNAAKNVILTANIIEPVLHKIYTAAVDYTHLATITHRAKQYGFIIKDISYAQNISLIVHILPKDEELFITQITEITNAKGILALIGEDFF